MDTLKVSVFNGVKDTIGTSVTLDAVINRIRTGERGLAKKTRLLQRPLSNRPVRLCETQEHTASGYMECAPNHQKAVRPRSRETYRT